MKTFEMRYKLESEPGGRFYKHVKAATESQAITIIEWENEREHAFDIYAQECPPLHKAADMRLDEMSLATAEAMGRAAYHQAVGDEPMPAQATKEGK
jgi:hypothetical protein